MCCFPLMTILHILPLSPHSTPYSIKMKGILFQPTYGTPVSDGFAQLRIFNGYNCDLTLSGENFTLPENMTTILIPPQSIYEDLHIPARGHVDLPYQIKGEMGSSCDGVNYTDSFRLWERTANSFFISRDGVHNFTDNNEKAIDGVRVR